jgi:hypothetical protein
VCGVFGYVSFDGKGPSIKRLQKIARATMRRGPHAFGFAWVDGQGRLKMYKQTGRIVDHLSLLMMAQDAQVLIGHCRYATHGTPDNNLNNHPHSADGGWIVHNGMIHDYEAIIRMSSLHPVTSCDSEVLGLLIEDGQGTLKERCVEAVQYASGLPLVLLGLWSRPGRMVALRSGNPLSMGICKGRVYLGSLEEGLPGKVVDVPDGGGVDFTVDRMKTFEFARNASGLSDEPEAETEDEPIPERPAPVRESAKPAKVKRVIKLREGSSHPLNDLLQGKLRKSPTKKPAKLPPYQAGKTLYELDDTNEGETT